jgi:hypothetical protein
MTKLVGLFKDQEKAEDAINALSAADLDDVEFKTIMQWDAEQEKQVKVAPVLNTGYGPSGIPVAATLASSWNLDDEEAEYFKRTVQHGGVLIVVDVDDEDRVSQVSHILEENAEKVAVS